jgi:hypothetical protein
MVGGEGASGSCEFAGGLESAELYDPSTASFTNAGEMTARRSLPRATLLETGDVLITGGWLYCGINCSLGSHPSAELYRPLSPASAEGGPVKSTMRLVRLSASYRQRVALRHGLPIAPPASRIQRAPRTDATRMLVRCSTAAGDCPSTS